MNIALIEDTPIRQSFVLNAIEALRSSYPDAVLATGVPFPLDEDNYSAGISAISSLSGGFIVLLDLDLSIESTLSEFTLPVKDLSESERRVIEEVVGSKYWPGLLIGRQAITNERLRPLVVSIVSNVSRPRRPQEYLESVVARTVDKRIAIQNYSASIESDEDAKKVLAEALKTFKELSGQTNALQRVWKRTANWFVDDREVELGVDSVPHSLLRKHNWRAYKDVFESAFEYELHPAVWESFESVYGVHEVLKTLVGRNYCGNSGARERKYNLSCGAVYLLILLAESSLDPDSASRPWNKAIKRFDKYPYIASPLLPIQSQEVARRAAIGLYTILGTLCVPEEKHGNVRVDRVYVRERGRELEVHFSPGWRTESFAHWAEGIHSDSRVLQEVWFSSREPERLQECIGAVWHALACSDNGFGAPGSVWMECNKLKFCSFADRRMRPEGER